MTTLPTANQKTDLITSVGDFGDNYLAGRVDDIWAKYDGQSGNLQYLYTRRDLIILAMGEVRRRVNLDAHQDVAIDEGDMIKALLSMKRDADNDIAKALAGGDVVGDATSFLPYAGELLTTGSTSVVGFPGRPDANSSFYRGDPYNIGPRRIR
jgi:hypothetical protein